MIIDIIGVYCLSMKIEGLDAYPARILVEF